MDSTEPKSALEKNQAKYAFAQRFQNLNAQTKMGIVGALIVFLALIAFGFIATRSLPGEALYGAKTQFIEELNQSVQFTPENKAAYTVSRLETRLLEVKTFAERNELSPEALEDLTRTITKHQQTLAALVTTDGDIAPNPAMLEILNNFAAAALAIETVSERNEKLQEFGEFMEDIRRESVNLYKDQIDRYVERGTEESVYEFIRTQLSDVRDALNNENLNEETVDDAEVYINRVGPAMTDGNYPRAIVAIAEAMRFIKIDTYGVILEETATNTSTSTAATSTATTTPTDTPSIETSPTQETVPAPAFNFSE